MANEMSVTSKKSIAQAANMTNAASPAEKPNVLWIFSDQHRADAMSCAGDPNIATPRLDRLAREGTRFTEAYSNTPICSPFRACLFTGRYATSHGVISLHRPPKPGLAMLAEELQAAGYDTSYMGKWHLSGGAAPSHFVSPHFRPGWDEWLGWENSNEPWATKYATGGFPLPVRTLKGYQTDALTDLTVNWLKRRAPDRPWFHVVSIEPPHEPHDAPGIDMEPFRDKPLQLPPNVPAELARDEGYLAKRRAYYAQIANLDRNVGRMLDALEASGQAERTIVFYFSDHGDMMGSHGRMGKSRPEVESSRIPLIVRYPEHVPAGREADGLISGVDLLPTLLGLLGLPVPDYAEGGDLSEFVRGEREDGADEVLLQFEHNFFETRPEQTFRTLIRDGWHYTCFLTEGPGGLHQLRADPHQLDNRIADPACADVREKLHRALFGKLDGIGDDFPVRLQRYRAAGGPLPSERP